MTALKPTRRADTWVVDVVWETKDVSLFLSNPVVVGDTLFGLSEKARGQFFALDAKRGTLLWLGQPRQASNTAIVKAGDLLFLLNQLVLQLTEDGNIVVNGHGCPRFVGGRCCSLLRFPSHRLRCWRPVAQTIWCERFPHLRRGR